MFPHITMCDWEFVKNNHILQKCSNGSEHFTTAVNNCLHMDKHFNISKFNLSLQYDRREFASNLSLEYGKTESISLESISNTIWYPVFHRRFGLCFTLDIAKHPKYKFVEFYKQPEAPALKFFFQHSTHPWTWMTLILHSEDDVADAMRSNPWGDFLYYL